MKNKSLSKWILVGLMAVIAILLIVVIVQLNKLNSRPEYPNGTPATESADVPLPAVDSATIEVIADEPVAEPAMEKPKVTTSPDMKWFRVQGPVKTIHETTVTTFEDGSYTDKETYHFDTKGKYSPGNPKNFTFKRNGNGQIIAMHEIWENEGASYGIDYEYTYDAQGYVKTESVAGIDGAGDYSYKMNENGWIVSRSYDGDVEGNPVRGKATYSYSNIDEYGNWLKATVRETTTWYGETDVTRRSITRKITYWE